MEGPTTRMDRSRAIHPTGQPNLQISPLYGTLSPTGPSHPTSWVTSYGTGHTLRVESARGLGHPAEWVAPWGAEKLGYETEAFVVYDVMGLPFLHFVLVMNAWGELALLLAADAKGNHSALPLSTIMIKQFQGQATYIEIARKEDNNVKTELVNLLAKHVEKSLEQIEADIRRPKYLVPVIYTERSPEDRGVVADLKKVQLI
ncbi:hypothetical protein UlMin_043522 [Ulmus minor]